MIFVHFQLDPVTLGRFILEQEEVDGHDLSLIFQSIGLATKVISSAIQKAGIKGLDGIHGVTNVQGETQQKLDVLSNTAMINVLKSSKVVCRMLNYFLICAVRRQVNCFPRRLASW